MIYEAVDVQTPTQSTLNFFARRWIYRSIGVGRRLHRHFVPRVFKRDACGPTSMGLLSFSATPRTLRDLSKKLSHFKISGAGVDSAALSGDNTL